LQRRAINRSPQHLLVKANVRDRAEMADGAHEDTQFWVFAVAIEEALRPARFRGAKKAHHMP